MPSTCRRRSKYGMCRRGRKAMTRRSANSGSRPQVIRPSFYFLRRRCLASHKWRCAKALERPIGLRGLPSSRCNVRFSPAPPESCQAAIGPIQAIRSPIRATSALADRQPKAASPQPTQKRSCVDRAIEWQKVGRVDRPVHSDRSWIAANRQSPHLLLAGRQMHPPGSSRSVR